MRGQFGVRLIHSVKIPFNNSCCTRQSSANSNIFGGVSISQDDGLRHVKKTLPPSLSGFPGEAEIRYYVKVTVGRASLWKENYRSVSIESWSDRSLFVPD
jgi:hypothetical protein